jgi:hypothetical protein
VPKYDGQRKLLHEMILVCNALRNDLNHPNEFVRGSMLRFLCKLREPELLEPLIPSIKVREGRGPAAAARCTTVSTSGHVGREPPHNFPSMSMMGAEAPPPSLRPAWSIGTRTCARTRR